MKICLDELVQGFGYRSKFFRWKEVLWLDKISMHAFPANDKVYLNIIESIKICDQIREFFDAPMYFTSFYRPPFYNTYIGGSLLSGHKIGIAWDFYIKGVDCDTVRAALAIKLEMLGIRMEKPPEGEKHNWVHNDRKDVGPSGRYFLLNGKG